MTRDLLKMATAWEDLCHGFHTRPALLVASPGTLVLSSAEDLTARLVAPVLLVLRICWVAYHIAHVTTLESRGTRHSAASFWCLLEVIST